MRPRVLSTLLRKEALRVAAQRGPLGMALLMIVTAVLVSTLGSRSLGSLAPGGDVSLCVVDYWQPNHWLEHLEENRPDEPEHRVEFRSMANHEGFIRYPMGSAGIQLRPLDVLPDASRTPSEAAALPRFKVWVWHPGGDGGAAGWCEDWFWRETRHFFLDQARTGLSGPERQRFDRNARGLTEVSPTTLRQSAHDDFRSRVAAGLRELARSEQESSAVVPALLVERSALRGGARVSAREAAGMGLTLLALFFVGVFLLPSITCEERERGTLLAIALSPASPRELVTAKLAFYFALATSLALLLAGISAPRALASPFSWLAISASAAGAVGVGMTIASIARTQRGASTGALLYLFATGVLLLVGKGGALEPLTWLMLERHGPEMLLAALSGNVGPGHWVSLSFTSGIALVWVLVAHVAHRRSGLR